VLFLMVVTLSVVETPLTMHGVIVEADVSRPAKLLAVALSAWIQRGARTRAMSGYSCLSSRDCHVYFLDNRDLVRISDNAARVEGLFSKSGPTCT